MAKTAQLTRAEAEAALAVAITRRATSELLLATAGAVKSMLEDQKVDPVEERNQRMQKWADDPTARIQACRKLYETDPLASVVVNRIVENEVGAGAELEANTGDAELNKTIEGLWYEWNETAEISGLSWGEFCQLSKVHEMVDGDVASVLLNDEDKIQLVGADQIKTAAGGGCGITTDAYNRPVTFHIVSGEEIVDYPASAVVYLARRKALRNSLGNRVIRGTSIFSANYELHSKACKWRNAEVNAAIVAARIVFWMVRNNPTGWAAGQPQNADGRRELDLSSDRGIMLEPGEELKSFQGTHPTNNFSEPFRLLIRELGAETGLPLEMLILDFSQGNYSSTRAALLFTQRAFSQRQAAFAARYLLPIYRWRVARWIVQGKLPDKDPRVFNARFIGPKWPTLDPLKEALAELLWRDLGCRTHSDWCLENGIDPAEQLERVAAFIKDCRDKGVPLYHSSSAVPLDAAADPTTAATDLNSAMQ